MDSKIYEKLPNWLKDMVDSATTQYNYAKNATNAERSLAIKSFLLNPEMTYGYVSAQQALRDYNSYNDLQTAMQNNNLEDISVKDLYTYFYNTDQISTKDYENALAQIEKLEERGSLSVIDLWHKDSTKEARKLYSEMTTLLNNGALKINDFDWDEYIRTGGAIGGQLPGDSIAYAPAPNYMDTDFAITQREVDPVKLWTGQELAELHNIDYDPNVYYDLIKRGTTAEVDRAMFESALMNEASNVQDTTNVASYLDSLRNTKAEALSTGATAGAQAAAEVLSNRNALQTKSNEQAQIGNERFNTVDPALLADSQARLNAENYFTSLANSLGQDILKLYANDTARYGQDLLTNAAMYAADQELRGQRAYSNASMYANKIQSDAAIKGYINQANSTANEFAYIYNILYNKNNGNKEKTFMDFQQLTQAQYSGGYPNVVDQYLANLQ